MRILATLALLTLGLGGAFGFVRLMTAAQWRCSLLIVVTSLGLSLGGLTTLMFWIAWLFPGRLGPASILPMVGGLAAAGLALSMHNKTVRRLPKRKTRAALPSTPFQLAIIVSSALIAIGMLINAAYWPFSDWDSLTIYAPLARGIFQHGALPKNTIYAGYPMLLPLSYAYAYWAAGSPSETWARMIPATTAIAAIVSAGLLAHEIRGRRSGILAAGLVALTPLYGRWATSGYTDVTAGFYFVLCALFAWRWTRTARTWDAVLSGTFAGCAMWTKSDGLLLVPTMLIVTALRPRLRGLRGRSPGARVKLPSAFWALLAMFLIGAPWFVHNIIELGTFIPSTIWIERAQRTVSSLFVFVAPDAQMGTPGWLYLAAIPYAAFHLVVDHHRRFGPWFFHFVFLIPFLAAWWYLASYDPRFLVTLVPLLGVLAALALDELLDVLGPAISPRMALTSSWSGALMCVLLLPSALGATVQHGSVILHEPRMGEAAKHRLLLGGTYSLAEFINGLPSGSKIAGVPPLSLYYIDQDRMGDLDTRGITSPPWDLMDEFDFVVYQWRNSDAPDWASAATTLLETGDGHVLYSTRPHEK